MNIRPLICGPTSSPAIQLLRYLAAGTAAFAVDYALLWACTEYAGINYLVSAVIGYCAGLAVSYTLSVAWVFDRRRLDSRLAEIGTFALIGVAGIGLTWLLMWLFTDRAGLHYMLSKVVTTAVVFAWNFTAKKIILFTRPGGGGAISE